MICTKYDLNWMICQVCDTKSITLCSWSIPHDVICIPRTDRYVIRKQAETAQDTESTSEHLRIEQYAIFRFIFEDEKLYRMTCTKNDSNWMICQVRETKSTTLWSSSISHDVICIPRTARYVCDTKSSRNSTIYRKRERTSTYTAVRDFPVYFEYEKTVPYDMH